VALSTNGVLRSLKAIEFINRASLLESRAEKIQGGDNGRGKRAERREYGERLRKGASKGKS